MALLEVQDIHAGYGKMEILKGVSLRVEAGQVVSIIGPNGAGKSTVFKTLFGLLPARQGHVRFDGEDVTNRLPADLLRRGITYVPQGRNVFPLMTVDENLRLGAYIRRRSADLDGEVER
ncbi:MAG: ATP-binding cassette domain-containing protein, partial [Candidatus Rokuibacteriota bacterium]